MTDDSWPQEGHDSAKTASVEAAWSQAAPQPGRRLRSVASPPVTSGRWIAYVSGEGRLVVRDHRTWHRRWETDLGLADQVESALRMRDFAFPSPAIADDVVCLRLDDDILLGGFDLDSGREVWTFVAEHTIESSPTVADGLILLADSVGGCYAINPGRGTSRWAITLTDEGIEHPPVAAGGLAYVATSDGMIHAIDIQRGKVLWPAVAGAYAHPSIAVSGAVLLATCADRLVGIDAHSGERRWRRRVGSSLGGLAVGRGAAVVCGESTVYGIAIADGAVRWERPLEGRLGAPAVAGDVIFVAAEAPARLYGLSLDAGRELWSAELKTPAICPPVPVDGRLFVTVAAGDLDVWRFGARGHSQSRSR